MAGALRWKQSFSRPFFARIVHIGIVLYGFPPLNMADAAVGSWNRYNSDARQWNQ